MGLFIEHTGFEIPEDPWNGWERGPDGSKLIINRDHGNHFVSFDNTSRLLNKTLTGLEPGETYRVSLRVKRHHDNLLTPTLWFELDGEPLEERFEVRDQHWQTLRWTFQAARAEHRLELLGHGITGELADGLGFDDIRIYPKQTAERFYGYPNQYISNGQSLPLPTMTVSLQAEPGGRTGILPTGNDYQYLSIHYVDGAPASPLQVNISLAWLCEKVRFEWRSRNERGEVRFYDAQGILQNTQTLPRPSGNAVNNWIEYAAPGHTDIARIEVNANDSSLLAYFTLWSL
ncbi:hypothetical protein ABE525_14370 [Pseudomonas wadenswilerensis]|uniref:CBM-cenC domain-containing protein n=1 Tax=Pseudomonas wadenswilerensis TaxID=1785161 RepID=A0A380T088_9PSED|nr:hypothetical protein [Pseudomonas]SPO66454.1 protein of unknown function [Pseudomonas sp. JV241A]SUQ63712.1 hypothetical protein CCOS864_03165 [Pseudomonas wadenswilerensis]